ncbi:HNH endonuclease [Chloroflexota bacterium]
MEKHKPVDRFTRRSRFGRHRIPPELREEVFNRDDFTCQYCGRKLPVSKLSIDHLVPVSGGGLDEIVNYVTSCLPCNQRKTNLPLVEFARTMQIPIEAIPVHGDPVIDNTKLPIQIRLLRKRIFDKIRTGEIRATGTGAQKKIEKHYRTEFWQTKDGKALETELPSLPGQARIMIPEIQTIAKNLREFLLLLELAKSANTRSLIGTVLTFDIDIESRVRSIMERTNDEPLRNRIMYALKRFERETKRRSLQP